MRPNKRIAEVFAKGNTTRSSSVERRPTGNARTFFKSALARQVKTDDLSPDDIIIAVMGPTGSGKSSFINAVTGLETGVGHDLESCTSNVSNVRLSIPEIAFGDLVFVDTPGFDDTHKKDVDILKMVADWLKSTYEKNILLSGLLYFHRISDNRMAGTPLKNLRMFEELCGKNAFQNVILTTTMWDEVDEETGEGRERELKTKYWRTMLERNSTTSRFLRTRESAFDIIEPLIEAANERSSVLLQNELVDMHKSLPATAAGQELFSAMGQLVSQREDLLRRIRHEMRQSNGDKMALEPLQEEHQKLQKSLQATVIEMRRLRLPLGKRLMNMTDKFFSSKFESLKSLITKRISKPTALNIESPTLSIDSSSYVPISPVDRVHVPTGTISNDPIDYAPQSPPGWTSQTSDNTVSSDRTTYPTRYGSSPVGQAYPNYDTPDNTMPPSDRTMYTTHGPSPVGQAYSNYDPPENTMYTTYHKPSPVGQAYMNYDRELPPRPYGEYSQSQPSNRWSQNPNDGY